MQEKNQMKKTQDKKEIIPQANKAVHKEKIEFVLRQHRTELR